MSLARLILSRSFSISRPNFTALSSRLQNTSGDKQLSSGELHIQKLLTEKFPTAKIVQVKDVSGGCGSMYEVYVESDEFKDVRLVKRHQMITQTLKNEIKAMHGIQIHAYTSDEVEK